MVTLTFEQAAELFSYDPESGDLTWKEAKPRVRIEAGGLAGCIDHEGYRIVRTGKKNYKAHRIAWLLQTGGWPELPLDHVNGTKQDNRWSNLRLAPGSMNQENIRAAHASNKTGLLGACWFAPNKYRARIKVQGRIKCLGVFETAEGAHERYVAAKRELHAGCTL